MAGLEVAYVERHQPRALGVYCGHQDGQILGISASSVWGEIRGPLEKVDNPEIELGSFWLDETERDLFRKTERGSFRVKGEEADVEEEGVTTSLEGRVVDRATGAGLPDATVVLFSTFYKRQIFYDHHLQEVAGALTGPDGSFTFSGFNADEVHFGAAGKAFLTVIRPGYVSCVGWYLGALTDWEPRDLALDLSFLGEGSWTADIFADGPNAGRFGDDYERRRMRVTASSRLLLRLAPGGGWAARITRR